MAVSLEQIIPIFRIFDQDKAKEFYIDYLGFQVDWEHRFEPGFPLYLQISKGVVKLHLSEHYGDCTPGSAIRIAVNGIKQLHEELISQQRSFSRPGLEQMPWGGEECIVTDPFGNRIAFYDAGEAEASE
ncbi:glyoxalase superfamily protein [Paenibacillus sp. NPDC058174]|uniref:glyoxalase superfamily protein n=1 Tax=Paenibacillus sp. NPDC058174 TaxID=3346366 RepID=UPI0036D80582